MSKKIYLLTMAMAVVLLSALGFASCVSETETLEGDTSEIVTRGVTFNIQLPSGDAVHFTRAQESNEYAVKSLWMLVFDAADDKLISRTNIVNDCTGGTYAWQYTYTTNSVGNAVRVVLVANEDFTSRLVTKNEAVANSTTATEYSGLDELKINTTALTANCYQTTVFDNSGANGLPMYGVAKTADGSEIIPLTSNSASQAVSVIMTRCVARLDLVNKVSDLTITGISFKNLNSTGFIKPHGSTGTITVPTTDISRVSGVVPFTALPVAGIVGSSEAETPASAKNLRSFYMFEEAAEASAASYPILQITGTLTGGIPVYYEVPFVAQNLETPGITGTRVEIERNNLYTLEITGSPTLNSRVNMSLKKTDTTDGVDGWGATGNNAVDTQQETLNNDAITCTAASGATYTAATHTFAADAASVTDQVLEFVSGMASSNPAITAVEVMLSGTSLWVPQATADTWTNDTAWLKAKFADGGATATISIADNAGTARSAAIRVTYTFTDSNSVAQTRKVIFTVNQAANS